MQREYRIITPKKLILKCDCGGVLRSTGMGVGNNVGTKWKHVCKACNEEVYVSDEYTGMVIYDEEEDET